MSLSSGPARCQARGTVLNTICEDALEAPRAEMADAGRQLRPAPPTIETAGGRLELRRGPRARRVRSPLSAESRSASCSDMEWQRQPHSFDDLYDATDDEADASEFCSPGSSTRPTSLETPVTRASSAATASRNKYPSLTIPTTSSASSSSAAAAAVWQSIQAAHKSSPIPPTPPPKIPVSPEALSVLRGFVPALHAPPSLDGSLSSDQVSNLSAPQTPDTRSLPDNDWSARDVLVRPDLEDGQPDHLPNPDASLGTEDVEIAIDQPQPGWHLQTLQMPPSRRLSNPMSRDQSNLSQQVCESSSSSLSDGGFALSEDALATLRHIPLDSGTGAWPDAVENQAQMWQQTSAQRESRPRSANDNATPSSDLSGYSFTNLSVPSPGGFFSSLAPRARHTWSFPKDDNPPSSAIATSFYNIPWNRSNNSGQVVEHVVECSNQVESDEQLTAVPQTAIRVTAAPITYSLFDDQETLPRNETNALGTIQRPDNVNEYDEHYDEGLKARSVASFDRTSVWLAAQASYLEVLRDSAGIEKELEKDPAAETVAHTTAEKVEQAAAETVADADAQADAKSNRKKSVRFADPPSELSGPPVLASRDSIYWRGFQSLRAQSSRYDSFIHRHTRFDAVQSMRLSLTNLHINCLLGKYEIAPHKRPPYKGPFSQAPRNSVLTSAVAERAEFAKLEKEQNVLYQLHPAVWAIDALRYMYGGRLIPSQASAQLSSTAPTRGARRARKPVRVLDLGGHAACEWAWHLAHDFPHAQIYTVLPQQARASSSNNVKGPSNHRRAFVDRLWQLPFRDNQFDLISARSLHAFLKTERVTAATATGTAGAEMDEYDLCLRECFRCLKPGGYLEFMLMDAEIVRPGPYASAVSVEFAFNLTTRGYDPKPTKSFLARLRKHGFVSLKRAWLFLPMGAVPLKPKPPRETPEPVFAPNRVHLYEAVQGPVGSTADVACITGLLGGWLWEQWLLKLQMEMDRDRRKLLDQTGRVFDEGRKNGAGWLCLSGWARKPKRRS